MADGFGTMGGVDTSSYRPYQPQNMLEQVGGMVHVAREAQGLKSDQYDLATRQLGTLRSTLSSLLANPNVSSKEVIEAGGKLAAEGIVTPQMLATELAGMPQDPNGLRQWLTGHLANTMDTQTKLQQLYGTNGIIDTGGTMQPVIQRSPMMGGGVVQTGAGIAREQDPNTLNAPFSWRDPSGRVVQGTQAQYQAAVRASRANGQQPPAPVPAAPGAAPAAPAEAPGAPPNATANPPQPAGGGIVANPQQDVGHEQYNKDLGLANDLGTANRPLFKAIGLMQQYKPLTGKGTFGLNDAKSILTNLGIDGGKFNDEQTALGELNKYLEQNARSMPSSMRSDAALQTFKESSPNLSTTADATLALAKQAVTWNRMDAAKAKAYGPKAQSGEFGDYPTHSANWVNGQDSRAYGIDLMSPEKRQALLDQMRNDAKSGDAGKKNAALKFWRSLQTAQQTGVLTGMGE